VRRQILAFALVLFALCALLTGARIVATGWPLDRIEQVQHLPIVWILTIEEALLGLGGCAIAWLLGRAYNGHIYSAKAFPKLARAVAFAFLAVGVVSLGDAACHWLFAYWSLALVKAVAVVTVALSVAAWIRGWPELLRWHEFLVEIESKMESGGGE
jgi:hypothetical protein